MIYPPVEFLSLNCLLQLLSMPLIFSYLLVLFQPMQLMLDGLSVQFLSMILIMNCLPTHWSPGKLLRKSLHFLPRSLRPWMLFLCCLSLISLGLSLYYGLLISLARRGCPLLHLLCRGGLLLGPGGLQSRLSTLGADSPSDLDTNWIWWLQWTSGLDTDQIWWLRWPRNKKNFEY